MKTTIGQVLQSVHNGALGRFAQASLPMRTALRLKGVLKAVDTVMKEYEKDRIALCKEYGTFNAATNVYDIAPEKDAEFQAKANALLENPAGIPGDAFTPASLLSSASFTTNDLMSLDWLIVTEAM